MTIQPDSSPHNLPAPKVQPAKPPVAKPFALHDIELLDGPFKTGQDVAADYLLALEPDRFLAKFRLEAGLEQKAAHYEGWESMGVSGHSLGHYLTACSLAWASTKRSDFLERVTYIVEELAECQQAHGDGYVSAIPEGKKAYTDIAAGDLRSGGFDLNGIWVPNYTHHKVFAGLRDAYRLCGNAKALEIEKGLADWFDTIHAGLNDEQMQTVLACEFGGLNETFADLYADTGDDRYLALARRFHHRTLIDPLAAGTDSLPGTHANTQIPKLVGLATLYELTGEPADHAAADFFWERVVNAHTYVTGGHCDGEHFGEPNKLNDRLSGSTTETCNVNNMLKLSEHVFGWRPEPAVADFYERALLNHIRSSQHPDGRVIYNLSLEPGGHKSYQRPFNQFTCCVGTGMENHVKYGQGIYFHNDTDLWVNLFIPSRLNWKSRGLTVQQDTNWPFGDTTTLTIKTDQPQSLTLRIRHPYWAATLEVKINGDPLPHDTTPSSYAVIEREWKDGDKIEVTFPMCLRTESMPDNPNRIAVFYGPTLLAADLGVCDDPAADQPGFVPCLLAGDAAVEEWVKPEALAKVHFKTVGVGKPRDVSLVPFHELHDRRYTVYLDKFTKDEWAERETEILTDEKERKRIAARTVDFFQPGEMQPERDHNFQGHESKPVDFRGKKGRYTDTDGWFSFEMKVDAEATNELYCTYWGHDNGERTFDVLVDDTLVATQTLEENETGEFWDQSTPLVPALTQGKQKVTVKFQSHPGKQAGGLFGARVMLAD
ncbi:MAG: glycosyl hydrolase [Verrucomicrobia bacterium]|nr:glycosyl hydrolase [Verrucomicrobiota bacterium]